MESWYKQLNEAFANFLIGGIVLFCIVILLIIAMTRKNLSVPIGLIIIAAIVYGLIFWMNFDHRASAFTFLPLFIAAIGTISVASYFLLKPYGFAYAIIAGSITALLFGAGYKPLHKSPEEFRYNVFSVIIHNQTDEELAFVFPSHTENAPPQLPHQNSDISNIIYPHSQHYLPYNWYGPSFFEEHGITATYLYILNLKAKQSKDELIQESDVVELLSFTEEDFVGESHHVYINDEK